MSPTKKQSAHVIKFRDRVLLANGCSHMAGVFQDYEAWSPGRSPGAKLASMLGIDVIDNIARRGAGNEYILRSTTEWISNNKLIWDRLVVVIGWSTAERREQWWYADNPHSQWRWKSLYDYDHDERGGMVNMQENDADLMRAIGDYDPNYLEFTKLYYRNLNLSHAAMMRTQHIVHAQNLLKTSGIPYVFYNSADWVRIEDAVFNEMFDADRFYAPGKDIWGMIGDDFKPGYCGHFDHDGTERIASLLHDFMGRSPAYADLW